MNLFNEAGQLTEEGKKETKEFKEMVDHFLSLGNSSNEVRLIGTILSQIVADTVSYKALNNK